jgi:hypothetical protein
VATVAAAPVATSAPLVTRASPPLAGAGPIAGAATRIAVAPIGRAVVPTRGAATGTVAVVGTARAIAVLGSCTHRYILPDGAETGRTH